MKMRVGIFFIFLMAIVVLISGCTTSMSPVPNNNISSLDPSEMALQVSDLPNGYMKGEAKTVTVSQDFAKTVTVKKGYQVTFMNGSTPLDTVLLSQTIFILPVDQVDQIMINFLSEFQKRGSPGVQLSNPGIGDSSIAYRVEDSQQNDIYILIFVKKDVAEYFVMGGMPADYETLKSIAKKAETKIK
jgi:ABC-type Fe3+-hydroxamate transport system substrate-binding protein